MSSLYSTNIKYYSDYNKVRKILEDRKRETYKLEGIEKVSFDKRGNLEVGFLVKESDELGYGEYSGVQLLTTFTPKYVFDHLTQLLKLPNRIYDYIQSFKRLPTSQRDVCLSNFSDNLSVLMNDRIERQKQNSRLREHFITIFNDVFGTFPRVIRSEIYRPYADAKALKDFNKNLEMLNENKQDANFYFERAKLSPYRSEFEYLNDTSKEKLEETGDEISHGIVNYNSETKDSSNGFKYLIMRLECSNGLTNIHTANELRVRHIGDDFAIKSRKAFIKTLQLGQRFAKLYYELDKKSKQISNDWNDLLEIPSDLLAMRKSEKQEVIDIAQKEEYEFSPYGLVQSLTFKSNHKDRKSYDRLNKKAVKVMKNVEKINSWTPKRLRHSKADEKPEEIDANDVELI
jgi:hypothetical protein